MTDGFRATGWAFALLLVFGLSALGVANLPTQILDLLTVLLTPVAYVIAGGALVTFAVALFAGLMYVAQDVGYVWFFLGALLFLLLGITPLITW